jgi:zinc transporter 1/2/3
MLVEHCVMQMQHHHSDVPYDVEKSKALYSSAEKEPMADKRSQYGSLERCESQEPSALHTYIHEHMAEAHDTSENHTTLEEQDGCVHLISQQHHDHHHLNAEQLHGLRAFILLLALSLHTVFEGMALGLQPSSSLLWMLTGAICLHKAVIAFTMGMQFTEKLADKSRVVLFLVLFAFMAPIGVGIGTLVGALGSPDSLATMIANVALQGLATGTFVYVTFFEVLQKEVGQNHSVLKVFAIMVGYAAIAVMKLLLPDPDA